MTPLRARSKSLDQPSDAGVAQLVEHQLPKLRVAGSSPVARSNKIERFGSVVRFEQAAAFTRNTRERDLLRERADACTRGVAPQ